MAVVSSEGTSEWSIMNERCKTSRKGSTYGIQMLSGGVAQFVSMACSMVMMCISRKGFPKSRLRLDDKSVFFGALCSIAFLFFNIVARGIKTKLSN
jgi:hypothetical protein